MHGWPFGAANLTRIHDREGHTQPVGKEAALLLAPLV